MTLIGLLNGLSKKIIGWQKISAQRRELRHLSDRLLKDIALSRIDADREANRAFWDTGPNDDATLRINRKFAARQASHNAKLRCCVHH